MNELALFAGAGGGILGGHLLGWRTICAVEWDAYAASILVQRQNDGSLPAFPIWDDVQTFDGRPWRGRVDVISGGFPCQDISSAGKGAGIDGERSGMWGHMARIIGQVRPEFCMVENSPLLVGRGLARVLGDLASLGYDAKWGVLGARNAGAPHKRDRIWIVGELPDSQLLRRNSRLRGQAGQQPGERREARGVIASSGEDVADAHGKRGRSGGAKRQDAVDAWKSSRHPGHDPGGVGWWATEPGLGRVAHGVAHRVDRLKCIGNGQVPQCAALAWRILTTDE